MAIQPHSRRAPMGGATLASLAMAGLLSMGATPMDALMGPHPDVAHAVHDAEHAVDYAWETYHRSALGGTIASPDLQLAVEEHLHEARALVLKAREAAEQGDRDLVDRALRTLTHHLHEALTGSMEHKK